MPLKHFNTSRRLHYALLASVSMARNLNDQKRARFSLSLVVIMLFSLQQISGSLETVVDGINSRRAQVSRLAGNGFGTRRQLKSGCGSFTACPSAADAAKVCGVPERLY